MARLVTVFRGKVLRVLVELGAVWLVWRGAVCPGGLGKAFSGGAGLAR